MSETAQKATGPKMHLPHSSRPFVRYTTLKLRASCGQLVPSRQVIQSEMEYVTCRKCLR